MYNAAAGDDIVTLAALNRRKRLNKKENNWMLGMFYDLVFGALPWTLGAAIIAVIFQSVVVADPSALTRYALFNSPVAISAISSFAAFLLVSKQSTALGNNSRIIGEFGNAAGACMNIALFLKSQMSSGKSIEHLTLPDGSGGFYQTTRPALILSSIMAVLKYSGRGKPIWAEGLAIAQDARLLSAYKAYMQPTNGSPGMGTFPALILMLSELIDEYQIGERASEYAVLFGQINALTAAEGAISGTNGYSGPYIMDYMLTLIYTMYLVLVIVANLVPNNAWNSVWIASILAFSTIGFMQVALRYKNPTNLRTRTSGQKPMISIAVLATEVNLNAVFARKQSKLINVLEAGASTSMAFGHHVPPDTGMRFSIVGNRR